MNRNNNRRNNSKKIIKSTAEKTGESSRTDMKRPGGREAKRQRVDVVQPMGFDTSQEEEVEDVSPLESQLMLSSQPLTDTQTSDFEAAPVEGMSSPLLHDLSPLLGANALDALDGWSLGSNLYFSDTGSGGGFLDSQASATEEERGMASPLLDVVPPQLGKGRSSKGKVASPNLLTSGSVSAKPLKPVLSQELLEDESLADLGDAGESSVSQSSLRMSDGKSHDSGDDEEEEMVLEFVPENKPKRRVRSRKRVDKAVPAKKDSHCVTDALVLCPEPSQGSSGTDMFAESENLTRSLSQSSLEVQVDATSPPRVVAPARSGVRLRRKKVVEALKFQQEQDDKNKSRSDAKTSQNVDMAMNDVSQEKNLEQKDVKSASKTSQNVDKKQGKYCAKNSVKSVIKTSKNANKFEPNTHVSQETNPATEDEESVAKTCGNVNELKSDSQSSVGEVSVGVELLKSNEQSPVAAVIQNVETLPTSSRLSLKRAGTLAGRQKNSQGDEKIIVSSLSSAVVEDTEDGDDTGSNLVDVKNDGRSNNAKSCSAPKNNNDDDNNNSNNNNNKKKSPVKKDKNRTRRKRGIMVVEEVEPAFVVDLEKPMIGKSGVNKTAEKTLADDGRTKQTDDGRTADGKTSGEGKTAGDGRSRSPSLFEYESDSMIAPSARVTHTRKPKRSTDGANKKVLDRSKHGETSSAGKTKPGKQLQNSNTSQIKAPRKSGNLSTSSKSTLTDSGIVATPASFTLASRPGLAKLTTSTPLDLYRSMVGLDKPRKGVKKAKRPRDSGNDSDFVLESNISMLSPVWPAPRVTAQGKGRGQLRGGKTVAIPKKGKISKDTAKVVSDTQPREAITGKRSAKRKKVTYVKEFLPSNEVAVEEASKKKDAVETARTATQIIGTADVKAEGPRKKKQDNRDVVSNEAKARQLNIEERLLQELDDIDQNYSLIIDD